MLGSKLQNAVQLNSISELRQKLDSASDPEDEGEGVEGDISINTKALEFDLF